MNKGILYALGAYISWGLLPVYWKALKTVPAGQILSHRIVWSLLLLILLVTWSRDWARLKTAVVQPRILLIYLVSGCLLGVNWLTYIWGVNAGFIIETSLGYFINPLVSVLFGVIFLREKLRPLQWIPVGMAGLGVLYLTISYGTLPWIALVLAFSFGFYGLVKKTAPLGALHGLTLETAVMVVPAVLFLLYAESQGSGAFGHQGTANTLLLVGTGIVTAAPLLFFAGAARRMDLSALGILQYISPTCQFLLGVLVYHEPFDASRLVGFVIIWAALVVYTAESIYERRRANNRS